MLKKFLVLCLVLLFASSPTPSFAQCQTSALNQGLISGLSVTGGGLIGNTDTKCVLDPQAAYRDFKVDSFDALVNQFYTLSRSTAKSTLQLPNGVINASGDGIYLQTSSMSVSGADPSSSGVKVIFIKGNLSITGNIDYAPNDPYSGLVFITSGDININSNVTKVNAILISSNSTNPPSSGKICTAYDGVCLDGSVDTPQLVVNGSLISLNKTDLPGGESAIQLKRNLVDNSTGAAEVINKQPKYLYILRNGLFTKDLVLVEEDKSYSITPDPGPPPPAPPPPQPACSPLTNPFTVDVFKYVDNCIIGI